MRRIKNCNCLECDDVMTWKQFPRHWSFVKWTPVTNESHSHRASNREPCCFPWWHHQMETFSALLTLCAGNSSITGEFPAQSQVTRSFLLFFDLHLNKRLSKQSWGWWFETPSGSLWRHCNALLWSWRGYWKKGSTLRINMDSFSSQYG